MRGFSSASQAEAYSTAHPRLLRKRLLILPYSRGFPSPDEGHLQELLMSIGYGCYAFLRMPPSTVGSNRIALKSDLPGLSPDPSLNPKQLSTIWEALTEILKLSGPVSSSVPEITVPISSNWLESNKLMCIKCLAHCQTPDRGSVH